MKDILPPEVEAAFAKEPEAARRFAALPPSHRREYLRWIKEAVRPEAREYRIERMVLRILGEKIKKASPGGEALNGTPEK